MMEKRRLKDFFSALLALSGVLLFLAAIFLSDSQGDGNAVARRLERRVEHRLILLDDCIGNPSLRVPEDMVIYRYVNDTLYSWSNSFPLLNDNLKGRLAIQRLMDARRNFVVSPLAEITDSLVFCNLGNKWFLAKSVTDGSAKVVAGIAMEENPELHLDDRYSLVPLSNSTGIPVSIYGRPAFKVSCESLAENRNLNSGLIWAAFALILTAAFLFLESKRCLFRCVSVTVLLLVLTASMYLWSRDTGPGVEWIFSPLLYSGGPMFTSLGSLLLINLFIILPVISLYLVRRNLSGIIRKKWAVVSCLVAGFLFSAAVCVYAFLALKNLVMNSNISLELFKVEDLSVWSFVVYLSFILLLFSVPLIARMLRPALSVLTGSHPDALSNAGRIVFAALVSLFLVTETSVLGFRKECDRLEVWANRLAVERDIMLELFLMGQESNIQDNIFISSLSFLADQENYIRNIIVERFLSPVSRDYNVTVYVLNEDTPRRRVQMLNSRISSGEPIAENSHFLYCETSSGQPRYDGVFVFMHQKYGVSRVIVEVQPRSLSQEKGYRALIGTSSPGRFDIPDQYSFARYKDKALVNYKGNYAYPSVISAGFFPEAFDGTGTTFKAEGYLHFVNTISEQESVVISRPVLSVWYHLVASLFVALLAFLIASLAVIGSSARKTDRKGYFKTRISWLVMISLFLTLVTLSVASVVYVSNRNEDNLHNLMSDRISSIQGLMEEEMNNVRPGTAGGGRMGWMSTQFQTSVETVASNTDSDITLYMGDGKLSLSTYRDMMEENMNGTLINRTAFENIVIKGKRFFIQKEKYEGVWIYNMYAPLYGPNNRVNWIMCTPYTGGETRAMETDTLRHIFTIFTIFIALLLLARFALNQVLGRMFKPLNEMGRKMDRAGLDSLEHIEYGRKDEISTLVEAYNSMVDELSENSLKLAQAERDKAWSGMARQVAHEIKNPLTPMKLQVQRLMRLKQRGDAGWQEKFDEVSALLLDHIDILTDTANEFSTFAKLYTEEPTEFDLDKVLIEEISMFDSHDGVEFDYIGFEGARVSGPKPQLTRVFVNLINNAVQAVTGIDGARIIVSLRNSTKDGYYDIVVEDNGSGVAPENIEKLFTPNFTTKSGGSGLGLAISRSILEKCGASISYGRSFQLGGACFTVSYPR